MPQAGFDLPSAEVQTSTECKFDAFTLQATTAGLTLFHYSELALIALSTLPTLSNCHWLCLPFYLVPKQKGNLICQGSFDQHLCFFYSAFSFTINQNAHSKPDKVTLT